MPTNPKTGEIVTWREFFRQWRRGMENVTPLQQAIGIQLGQFITLIGMIWGIVFSIRIGYWWMGIVLIGGLIVLGVQILGNWQKKMIAKMMDHVYQGAEEEQHGMG